jgi:hypothetical protein
MRRRFVLAYTTAFVLQALCLATGTQALAAIPCDAFQKNADGSWTVLIDTYIEGPALKVREGGVLEPGRYVAGYDIAAMITKACPNAAVAPPEGTSVQAPPGAAFPTQPGVAVAPPPPMFPLEKYADANGDIDVRKLTCGHLDNTSVEEARLVLAWYSGWYHAVAKKRGINLARVRYAIQNVADYCKTNRDKSLSQVMELMLK